MICVSDTPDVEQVIAAKHGVSETISAGKLVIDHSTISPQTTRESWAAMLNAKGAPCSTPLISGGSEGAARGTPSASWSAAIRSNLNAHAPIWKHSARPSPMRRQPGRGSNGQTGQPNSRRQYPYGRM